MNKNNIIKYKEKYNGKCLIVPCEDLEKMEGNFNNIKEEIIDAFREERIISDWSLKKSIFKDGELIDSEAYEDDCYENEEDFIWQQLVCRCMRTGFFVIYESPVPCDVKKHKEIKFYSRASRISYQITALWIAFVIGWFIGELLR